MFILIKFVVVTMSKKFRESDALTSTILRVFILQELDILA